MKVEPDLHETLRGFTGILDRMEVPYAVGGAIAMAFAGHVRGTRDVDVLVLIPAVRYQEFVDQLNSLDFKFRDAEDRERPVDVPSLVDSIRFSGLVRVWRGATLVEIFPPRVPLQDAILKRRTRATVGDLSMWLTTVEDLILLKMIFHRPKDIEDVRHLIAANTGRLDRTYLTGWIPRTLEPAVGSELEGLLKELA